jgi:hypothetical protein
VASLRRTNHVSQKIAASKKERPRDRICVSRDCRDCRASFGGIRKRHVYRRFEESDVLENVVSNPVQIQNGGSYFAGCTKSDQHEILVINMTKRSTRAMEFAPLSQTAVLTLTFAGCGFGNFG